MADYKIKWNGLVDDSESDSLVSADNNEVPTSVDLGTWGGYVPVWFKSGCYTGVFPFGFTRGFCEIGVMDDPVYFEDYDLNNDGVLDGDDRALWFYFGGHPLNHANRSDISTQVRDFMDGTEPMPDKAPKNTYTWGDVAFALEVFDGIGTGSRKARQDRLDKFDDEKKRKLIHLICRVKGEKVYDEEKEVGDTYIKLEDAELVINEVLGKIKVEKADVL